MSTRISMSVILSILAVGCTMGSTDGGGGGGGGGISTPAKERDAILFASRAGYVDINVLEAHHMWPERYGCSGWGTLSRSFEVLARDVRGRHVRFVVCCAEASNGMNCGYGDGDRGDMTPAPAGSIKPERE